MNPSATVNPGTAGLVQALSRKSVRGIGSRRARVLRNCPERRDANAAIKALNKDTAGAGWPELGPSTPPSSSRAVERLAAHMLAPKPGDVGDA